MLINNVCPFCESKKHNEEFYECGSTDKEQVKNCRIIQLENLLGYGGAIEVRRCNECYKPYPDFSISTSANCYKCRTKKKINKYKRQIQELQEQLERETHYELISEQDHNMDEVTKWTKNYE